jgi:hypothetical protein
MGLSILAYRDSGLVQKAMLPAINAHLHIKAFVPMAL